MGRRRRKKGSGGMRKWVPIVVKRTKFDKVVVPRYSPRPSREGRRTLTVEEKKTP